MSHREESCGFGYLKIYFELFNVAASFAPGI